MEAEGRDAIDHANGDAQDGDTTEDSSNLQDLHRYLSLRLSLSLDLRRSFGLNKPN